MRATKGNIITHWVVAILFHVLLLWSPFILAGDKPRKERSASLHQQLVLSHANEHYSKRRSNMPAGMKERDLLWKMNGAGLYNHIFDFKYVLPFASNYSRRVFVEPLRSPHYDTDLILCDYLAMPGLHCLRKRSLLSSNCGGHFQNAIKSIQQNKTHICFAEAAFNRTNLHRQRYHIYLAPQPRLTFQPKYVVLFISLLQEMDKKWPATYYKPDAFHSLNRSSPLWPAHDRYRQHNFGEQFPWQVFARDRRPLSSMEVHRKETAGNRNISIPATLPFIVVHWRRGDQLDTRCDKNFDGNRDLSPNCAGIDEFLLHLHHERIRFPPETRFLIATNEGNPDILRALRRHQYIILSDLLHSFRYQQFTITAFKPNQTLLADYTYFDTVSEAEKHHEDVRLSEVFLELHLHRILSIEVAEKKRLERLARQRNKSAELAKMADEEKDGEGGDEGDENEDPLKDPYADVTTTTNKGSGRPRKGGRKEKRGPRKHGPKEGKGKKKANKERSSINDARRLQEVSPPITPSKVTNLDAIPGLKRVVLRHANNKSEETEASVAVSAASTSSRRAVKPHPYGMGRLTAMDEFVLESLFMLHAAVSINYGISTIHDAIESERYLMVQEEQRLHPTRPSSISVCYMVQDRYSWCHGLEVERNYRQFGLPFTFEDKRGVVKRFDQFNLLPAYPNSALVLPEAG